MEIKINPVKYTTELSKLYGKMKDLRRLHFRKTWEAQSKGAPVIQGLIQGSQGYFSGIGEFANPSYGPYYTIMMRNHPENLKCQEAIETFGWTNDLCSSMRVNLGQTLRGLSTRGPKGETVIPNFTLQGVGCHSVAKMGQFFTEYLGIPWFAHDTPFKDSPGHVLPEQRQYYIDHMAEGIEWMEKTLGIKYDDERAVEHTKNEWQTYAMMTKIYEEMKNIPAPWDYRLMWAMRLPGVTMRHEAVVVEYFRELLDETRDRVQRGISARGYEKIRLMHDGAPPFFNISTLRYPANYGGVIVGGPLLIGFGRWRHLPNGTWLPVGTLEEEGREIRNRQDVLQATADMYIDYAWHAMSCCHTRPEEVVAMARDWKCQGAVLHMDRGCKAEQTGMAEGKLALQKAGYPVMVYEASQADPRDFSQATVFDRFDAFLESLGLTRLELEETAEAAEDVGGEAHGG